MGIDLKTVGSVLRKADKIEELQKILDMQSQLNDLKEENHELKKENRILKERLEMKDKVVFEIENNACWIIGKKGKKEGPLCSACYDTKGKIVRMHQKPNEDFYFCPSEGCNNSIGTRKMPHRRTHKNNLNFMV